MSRETVEYIGYLEHPTTGKIYGYVTEIDWEDANYFKGEIVQYGYWGKWTPRNKKKVWIRINNPRTQISKDNLILTSGNVKLNIEQDVKIEGRYNMYKQKSDGVDAVVYKIRNTTGVKGLRDFLYKSLRKTDVTVLNGGESFIIKASENEMDLIMKYLRKFDKNRNAYIIDTANNKVYDPKENIVKEDWGSSDTSIMVKAIEKDLKSAGVKTDNMFSLILDDKFRNIVADSVDFYWDDWEEYKQNREKLIDHAVHIFLNRKFGDQYRKAQQMFSKRESIRRKIRKIIEEEFANEDYQDYRNHYPTRFKGTRKWVSMVGKLDNFIMWSSSEPAKTAWEKKSGEYLTGDGDPFSDEDGANFWDDLSDEDLKNAAFDARDIIYKFKLAKRTEQINEITDAEGEVAEDIDQLQELTNELKLLKARIKNLESQIKPLDNKLRSVLEETEDGLIRTRQNLLRITKIAHDRETVSYKNLYTALYNKVSPQLQKMFNRTRNEIAKTSRIATAFESIKISNLSDEERHRLGLDESLFGKIKKTWNKLLRSIGLRKNSFEEINDTLDSFNLTLEKHIAKYT